MAVGRASGERVPGADQSSITYQTPTAGLADVGRVDHLVLAAINRDENTAADYDHARSLPLVTLKMVGYLEVVHALLPRISPDGSIVIFGGLAKDPAVPGLFLLENRSVNAANLPVDGGTLLR